MGIEQPIDTQPPLDHEPKLNKFFRAAIKTRASDLHLKVGQTPKLRLFGELKKTTGDVLTPEKMQELVFELLSASIPELDSLRTVQRYPIVPSVVLDAPVDAFP